jgi:hypothetical protein
MPSAADITLTDRASILLIGDSGTHKTHFIGTCPMPAYIFDFDAGVGIHRGRGDIFYDTFKEGVKGQVVKTGGGLGVYEYGKAWPAFLQRLNEVGKQIDDGTCPYKTIAFDSLTLLTDICLSYILAANKREVPEIRDWGAFLNNMSTVFGQITGWPLVKIVTAHIKRAENKLTEVEEKLPLLPGQFAGKVSVLFDEVYFTEFKQADTKNPMKWILRTQPTGVIRQAKSRLYNLPDGTEASFAAIEKHIASLRA